MTNEKELKKKIRSLAKEKKISKAEKESIIAMIDHFGLDKWREGAFEGFQRG